MVLAEKKKFGIIISSYQMTWQIDNHYRIHNIYKQPKRFVIMGFIISKNNPKKQLKASLG